MLAVRMRALVAMILAIALVAAVAPHVHLHATGGDECVACVLGHTAPPATGAVDLAPLVVVEGEAPAARGLRASGAPQGAVPGQSPPGAC